MDNAEEIKRLLLQLIDNKEKIIELEKYSINDIISVALDNKLYESLKIVFQPISINGSVKIYFDAFSTNILYIIGSAYNTKEEAIEAANSEYQSIQKAKEKQSEDDLFFKDERTYEEILNSKIVIPKEIKENIISSLFKIDFDLISQIKIKDSHARQISGIGHPIHNINDIIFYSEPACLETCIELFNKNIQTTMNDTEGVIEDPPLSDGICKVHLSYETLSPENKIIADELVAKGKAERFMDGSIDSLSIFVPCNSNDTVGEVSSRLKNVASKFLPQDILYGRATPEETYQGLKKTINRYSFLAKGCFDNGFSVEGLLKFTRKIGDNMFYDEEEGLLWDCPEYYQKHLAFLSMLSDSKDKSKI